MAMVIAVIAAFILLGHNGVSCCDETQPCMLPTHFFEREMLVLNSDTRKSSLRTGNKSFSENCTCEGKEIPGYGRGIRYFEVTCTNRIQLSCMYRGNPHHCRAYNNGRQRQFYTQLLNCIGHNMCLEPFGNCPARKDGYFAPMCSHNDLANFKLDKRDIPHNKLCKR